MGVRPTKFNKLSTPWVTQLWYLHKHTTLNWSDSVYQSTMLCCTVYPKICFRKCSHFSPRGGKIQKLFGGRIPTKLFVTNNHLSFLHTQYSMVPFCRCPPPDKFLKKPCVQIISLYEDGLWVMVGQMLHCKVVTYKYIYFLIIYGWIIFTRVKHELD